MTALREEARRQLDEVYRDLRQFLQQHPEDETSFEEILAKVRIAEAMLAGEELDDDDKRMLPPRSDDPEG